MRRRLVHAAEIEQGLRRALTDGELRLHYQPILDLQTGTIVAVEALVRWQHPDHGLLAPAQFLAAAEATGLAVPLGAEILSIACRELAHWGSLLGPRARGAGRARQHLRAALRGPGPRRHRRRARCSAAACAPDKLVLEIAETMFTGEGQAAMAQLDDLRGVGVRIALDRFGTGYSSLAAIRRLPFDALKVDSSFLTELGHGTRDARARRGDGRHGPLARAADDRREGRDRGAAARCCARSGWTARRASSSRRRCRPRPRSSSCAPGRSGRACSSRRGRSRARRSPPVAGPAQETAGDGGPSPSVAHPEPRPGGAGARHLDDDRAALGRRRPPRRDAHRGRPPPLRRLGGAPPAGRARAPGDRADRAAAARAAEPRPAGRDPRHAAGRAELAQPVRRAARGLLRRARGLAAAERWLGAIASAAETANYEMLHEATGALMRTAERAGSSLLERHLAIERFAETAARALTRRSCPREEIARGPAPVRGARSAPARRRRLGRACRLQPSRLGSGPHTRAVHLKVALRRPNTTPRSTVGSWKRRRWTSRRKPTCIPTSPSPGDGDQTYRRCRPALRLPRPSSPCGWRARSHGSCTSPAASCASRSRRRPARVEVLLCDVDGIVLSRMTPSRALEIATGSPVVGGTR